MKSLKREVLDALGDPENEAWLASYLDLYARKLAEKQRQAVEQARRHGNTLSPEYLIRLIDPET